MAWMGSRSNVAAITALDVSDLQDNIVFAATSELKFLMLQKTSTATVDNATVWNATPSGRWHLVGGSGAATSSIEVLANLVALKALTSASQDKLYSLNTTPPILYSWDAESTATADDDLIVQVTALATGRMYKIYPVASGGGSGGMLSVANIAAVTALNISTLSDGANVYAIAEKLTLVLDKAYSAAQNNITVWDSISGTACWFAHSSSTVISTSNPGGSSALFGTTWIWAETDYLTDFTKRVITYNYRNVDGTPTWVEVASRLRRGAGTPVALAVPTDSAFETYLDTATNRLWHSYSDGEGGYSWAIDA